MADEGFHEIQLNGKQLVFLFMAATVIAVVIFLCGVMVGRGVRAQQGVLAAAATVIPSDPTITTAAPPPPSTGNSGGAPLSTQETLTYADRLQESGPAPETLREAPPDIAEEPAPAPPPPAAESVRRELAAPATDRRAAAASSAIGSEPAGGGFVVQVAAVRQRAEADTIARRLTTKGYPAFVTTPAGVVRVFRVRVGKYADRRAAEAIAAKLEREEQFKPWITR